MGSIISHIYDFIQLYGSYDNYLKEMNEKELAEKAKQEAGPILEPLSGSAVPTS